MDGTQMREQVRSQSATMIGPSVFLMRLSDTMVLCNVDTAIAVLVGCFSHPDPGFQPCPRTLRAT